MFWILASWSVYTSDLHCRGGRSRTALSQSGCYRIILVRGFLICSLTFVRVVCWTFSFVCFYLSLRSRQRYKEFADLGTSIYYLSCHSAIWSLFWVLVVFKKLPRFRGWICIFLYWVEHTRDLVGCQEPSLPRWFIYQDHAAACKSDLVAFPGTRCRLKQNTWKEHGPNFVSVNIFLVFRCARESLAL